MVKSALLPFRGFNVSDDPVHAYEADLACVLDCFFVANLVAVEGMKLKRGKRYQLFADLLTIGQALSLVSDHRHGQRTHCMEPGLASHCARLAWPLPGHSQPLGRLPRDQADAVASAANAAGLIAQAGEQRQGEAVRRSGPPGADAGPVPVLQQQSREEMEEFLGVPLGHLIDPIRGDAEAG